MKKFIIIFISLFLVVFSILYSTFFTKKDTIKVAEVTHSLFYTPFYVAIENGYFKDEGLNIELILTSGADKVASSVLSNDVQIGFAGPEATIYVYKNNEKDYLVTFAGLTKKDGQFIVSRNNISNFNIEDLYGKKVLAGRAGGMPVLNFLNGIKKLNGDSSKIDIDTRIDFSSLTGTFISGYGDYVNLFEPNATKLEKLGLGHVVASIGEYSGDLPYTAFFSRKSYINNNKDTIERFNKALNRGLLYVQQHDENDIAKVVLNQFSDTSLDDIKTIVKRYKDNDTWFNNTTIEEKYFNNLENIMIDNNLLDKYVPFNNLVINLNE